MLHIKKAYCGYTAEPLKAPFGFKGKYIDVLWQSVVTLEDEEGHIGCAPGVQSIVWSDAAVIEALGPDEGNKAMFRVTRKAIEMVQGRSYRDPFEMIHSLLPLLLNYAAEITGLKTVRPTFVLNALVPLDLAAWQLWARIRGVTGFEELVPNTYHHALSEHHTKLAGIPLVSYNVSCEEVGKLAEGGNFLLKIKLGNDPDKDDNREKMLQWDMKRVTELHEVLKTRRTSYTDNGKIAYYFDANGRYDSKDRLSRLIDHLDYIGALNQTVLLEEPFEEGSGIAVHGIPIRIAADESAHGVEDAKSLIDLGYGAMALKPIAKTLSISLEVAKYATERNIPCFCADLTVNPLMVDWNKNVAARLKAIPGMKVGALESNGSQNYPEWERLISYHSMPKSSWITPQNGLFHLDDDFYEKCGGVLLDSEYYLSVTER